MNGRSTTMREEEEIAYVHVINCKLSLSTQNHIGSLFVTTSSSDVDGTLDNSHREDRGSTSKMDSEDYAITWRSACTESKMRWLCALSISQAILIDTPDLILRCYR